MKKSLKFSHSQKRRKTGCWNASAICYCVNNEKCFYYLSRPELKTSIACQLVRAKLWIRLLKHVTHEPIA